MLSEEGTLIERLGVDELEAPLEGARAAIEAAALPQQPLHGDSHAGNLLQTPSGLLWTDFEDACAGPVEWDLGCLTATSADPAAALRAYGYQGGEDALAPFVEARLIQTATWTALLATEHPHLRARVEERLGRWRGA